MHTNDFFGSLDHRNVICSIVITMFALSIAIRLKIPAFKCFISINDVQSTNDTFSNIVSVTIQITMIVSMTAFTENVRQQQHFLPWVHSQLGGISRQVQLKWDTVSDIVLNVQNRIRVPSGVNGKKCFVAYAALRRAVHRKIYSPPLLVHVAAPPQPGTLAIQIKLSVGYCLTKFYKRFVPRLLAHVCTS